MAEAIAKLVLNKLADIAVKEAVFLYGAGDKVDSLHHELSYIQAFLRDAESKHNSANERVKTWVNDVREVAYRIEDVIDTLVAEVDKRYRPGNLNTLKRIIRNPKKLPIVHNLTCEMDKIQTRLREMKDLTKGYGINRELGDNNNSSVLQMGRPVTLPDSDDLDILDRHRDTENIVKLLVDPTTKRRCVVSIVGQGGLGKTTVARKSYNSDVVKREFEFRLWLSVSQQFVLVDLLKSMLEKLRPLKEDEKAMISQERAIGHFCTEVRASLSQKRYLIIMDDVWRDELWTQVKVALPDDGNGSRVLVTTRFSDIAQKADPTCHPYELHYLSEEESLHLLLKKAFSYQDPKQINLHDVSDLLKKFAKRCAGLPLALVAVGGLLSIKPPTYHSWHKIFEKFSWIGDEGNKCIEILATSYEDLPLVLKPCFMYFGLYPEDHQIKVKSLIRMWVAEGFIPEKDGTTMEQTAEDYLEELVQRSMIQVSHRYLNGSIKYCRIHDLLHDLAIGKCKENGFLEIIPSQPSQGGTCGSSAVNLNVHRAALHSDRKDVMANISPNLRTLFLYNNPYKFPNVEKFRLLKIWNRSFNGRGYELSDMSKKLVQLKYIEDKNSWFTFHTDGCSYFWAARKFWRTIHRMRNLQTLDISLMYTGSYGLPDCIWDIRTLRHVMVDRFCYNGPPSNTELPNLQTLKYVEIRKKWMTRGWPRMPSIRVLKLIDYFRELPNNYGESMCTFLSGLHHLTSLYVDINIHFDMRDLSVFPWYNHLQSLNVIGPTPWRDPVLHVVVTTSSFPIHLTKLRLEGCSITEDPMPVLEKLESLRLLKLGMRSYTGRKLCCSAGGFPHLQYLTLQQLSDLEEWKVADHHIEEEEGAMPIMKEINVRLSEKLEEWKPTDYQAEEEEGAMPIMKEINVQLSEKLEEWKPTDYHAEGEEGAMPIMKEIMPMLKEIKLDRCRKLRVVPGLSYMTSLSKFHLNWGSPDLQRSVREDESHQMREGQFVEFRITEDDFNWSARPI